MKDTKVPPGIQSHMMEIKVLKKPRKGNPESMHLVSCPEGPCGGIFLSMGMRDYTKCPYCGYHDDTGFFPDFEPSIGSHEKPPIRCAVSGVAPPERGISEKP